MRKLLITILLASVSTVLFAQTNVWQDKASMPNPGVGRFLGTGFAIGDKLYFGTGLDASYTTPLGDFWEYNTTNNTWTQLGAFDGGARYGAVGFSINGKGYIGLGTDFTTMYNDLWEYDPNTDNWTQKANFDGGGRAGAFVFVVNNKAYVGTGQDINSNVYTDVYEYDPAGNNWTNKASMPGVSRMYAGAFAIGAKGYVGTGLDSNNDPMGDFYEFNPSTNQWTKKADYANGTLSVDAAVAFSLNNRGYLGRGSANLFWQYNPHLNLWTQKANISTGVLVNAVAVATATKGYVFSGLGVTTEVSLKEYTPDPTLSDQTITFNSLADKTFGDVNFNLTATSNSLLAVSYSSSNVSVATVSGNTVTIVGAGQTTITATQAGNATYDPAPPVEQTLTVTKAAQTITFNALPAKAPSDLPFTLTATASSGLAVSYVSSDLTVATISGSTVTIVGGGTTTITASQGGNANYNAATDVPQDLVVAKLDQTITFSSLPNKKFGDASFALTATSNSSLSVAYVSSNTSVATINGSTVTILSVGSTTITASQAGNASYNAAAPVDQTLTIAKGDQTWSAALPTTAGYKNNIVLNLTLSSGLAYTLTSSDPSIATVALDGNSWKISPVGIGSTTLNASQTGNSNYNDAPTLTSTLVVGKGAQTITVEPISPKTYGDPPFIISASSSSGLPVTIDPSSDLNASVYLVETVGRIYGAGTTVLNTHVPGNDFYLEGTGTLSISVAKANQTLTFEPLPEKAFGDAPFDLSARSTLGYVVPIFTSSNPDVATISGKKVTIVGKGTTMIAAYGLGDTRYNSAPTVIRELNVRDAQTITFAELPAKTLGDPDFTLSATASSGLAVTFSSSDANVASITGSKVKINGVGTTAIAATAGNSTYAKVQVTRLLTVKNISQAPSEQGQLVGVQTGGGDQRLGLIFKANGDGSGYSILHEFKADLSGSSPSGSMNLASNGKFYGATSVGGVNNGGVLYEFDPATGTFTKKQDFELYDYPIRTWAASPNGKLYGATQRGIFEYDVVTNTFKKLLYNEVDYVSDFIYTAGGKIYGMGRKRADPNKKVVFEYDPIANVIAIKLDFDGQNISTPLGLVEADNGKIYGTTTYLGANGKGEIIEFDPAANVVTHRFSFGTSTLGGGATGLTKAPNGKLYGTTFDGGVDAVGSIFEFDPATNTVTAKHDFRNPGGRPSAKMTLASNGKLYGSDSDSGGGGSLFEFDPMTGIYVRKMFYPDRQGSVGGSFVLFNDKLFVTIANGGINKVGNIMQYDYATNVMSNKYDFLYSSDGVAPTGKLIQLSNGKLYGTTNEGGSNNSGVIFEIDAQTGTYTKRFDFQLAGGNRTEATLTQGLNGRLYGTAQGGGFGYLFEFDPQTVAFKQNYVFYFDTGYGVWSALTPAGDGKFMGMTSMGGENSSSGNIGGSLFEVDPLTFSFSKKMSFALATGVEPHGSLTLASNGKFYGVTLKGGDNNQGVLFEYDRLSNTYTVKHHFATTTGSGSIATLVEGNGKLYGATVYGGASNLGTLFEYDLTSGAFTTKFEFTPTTQGLNPRGSLVLAANGNLYGMTNSGGTGSGVLYEFNITTNSFSKKKDFGFASYWSMNDTPSLIQIQKALRNDQTITFETINSKVLGDTPFTISATASSSLPVMFTTSSDKVTIANNTITLVKAGSVTLKANQSGDASYNAAPEVEKTFCINPSKPIITMNGENTDQVTLTSTGVSGNQWFKDGVAISGATGVTFIAPGPGVYQVQVSVDNCTSEMSEAQVLIVTGDKDMHRQNVMLYPNPVKDDLFVVLSDAGQHEVAVHQVDGRQLYSKQTGESILQIDVRQFGSGLHLVRVKDARGTMSTMKFIKK